MSPSSAIRVGVTLGSTIYAIVLYLLGVYPTQFRYVLTYLPTVVLLGLVVFEKWAWRWPVVHRATGHPWIGGTWKAVLTPGAESRIPKGGNRGPIVAYLAVEQTYWGTYLVLRTAESTSKSSNASVDRMQSSGTAAIRFSYDNVPRIEHQNRSPRHEGACRISVTGLRPEAAEGYYFTNRYTAGDMVLTLLDRSTDYGTYAQIQAADNQRPA